MRREYEVGSRHWLGWVVVRDYAPDALSIAVGARGVGHDEPSTYASATLTLAEVAELRDKLTEYLGDWDGEPAQTYNYTPRPCDACGEMVEIERDRFAWSGQRRRIGWRWRTSWFGHIRCRPACLPRGWFAW